MDSKIRSHASHPVINWGAPAEPFEKREPDDRPDKGAYLIIISLLSYPCCRSGSGRRFGRSSLLLLLACGDSQVHPLRRSTVGIATNQRSNQVQERLVLGMSAATAQEGADVEIGHMAA